MPILLQWSETVGRGATIKLDNGDVVHVSVTRRGVSVRQWDVSSLWRTLLSNLFGPKLYRERNALRNSHVADELNLIFPHRAPELPRFQNRLLAAFANAIWHSRSAADAGAILQQAAAAAANPD